MGVSHSPLHEPLSNATAQIRLLRPLTPPQEGNDILHFDLNSFSLGKAPSFNAISYTWGPREPRETIVVNQQEVLTRHNCYYALWQACRHSQDSYIWIDSICINQEDLDEKGAQVAIMGDVYAQAQNVLVCIGPEDEASRFIQQVLPEIDNRVQYFSQEARDASPDRFREIWQPPGGDEALLEICDYWDTFCERPYFHRLWVVQELFEGLGRLIVLCGQSTMSWDDLVQLSVRLFDCFNANIDMLPSRSYCSSAIRILHNLIYFRETGDFDLPSIIRRTTSLGCEDPRDRIFGTLRLPDWEELGLDAPKPDYSISNYDLAWNTIFNFEIDDLLDICTLAKALNLNKDNQVKDGVSWLEVMELREDTTSPQVFWNSTIHGASQIRIDRHHRLCVDLRRAPTNLDGIDFSKLMPTAEDFQVEQKAAPFCDYQFTELFTNSEVSAISRGDVKPGDILLQTYAFDVVVRPQPDGRSFQVLGQALLLKDFKTRIQGEWDCNCWSFNKKGYKQRLITLGFQESVDVILNYAAMVCKRDKTTIAPRISLDIPRAGTILQDLTLASWREDQFIKAVDSSCEEHAQDANEHRKNGLFFCANSGCGPSVYVNE